MEVGGEAIARRGEVGASPVVEIVGRVDDGEVEVGDTGLVVGVGEGGGWRGEEEEEKEKEEKRWRERHWSSGDGALVLE